ncbi:MAG: hypothetical protein WBN90_09955 [Gammaproteobacteria bacterium]
MTLELVPIDGERILTPEEKERLRSRTRNIPPAAIEAFTEGEVEEIKDFLVHFILVNEQLHHDKKHEDLTEYYKSRIEALQAKRHAMFEDLSPGLARFIKLLDLCPMEPWKEIEALIEHLQKDNFWDEYRVRRDTGIEAALDNPFLLQQDDHIEADNLELRVQCRVTPSDVYSMIAHLSLQDLVKHIINSRKRIIGCFWDDEHFDV